MSLVLLNFLEFMYYAWMLGSSTLLFNALSGIICPTVRYANSGKTQATKLPYCGFPATDRRT